MSDDNSVSKVLGRTIGQLIRLARTIQEDEKALHGKADNGRTGAARAGE